MHTRSFAFRFFVIVEDILLSTHCKLRIIIQEDCNHSCACTWKKEKEKGKRK